MAEQVVCMNINGCFCGVHQESKSVIVWYLSYSRVSSIIRTNNRTVRHLAEPGIMKIVVQLVQDRERLQCLDLIKEWYGIAGEYKLKNFIALSNYLTKINVTWKLALSVNSSVASQWNLQTRLMMRIEKKEEIYKMRMQEYEMLQQI